MDIPQVPNKRSLRKTTLDLETRVYNLEQAFQALWVMVKSLRSKLDADTEKQEKLQERVRKGSRIGEGQEGPSGPEQSTA